MAADAVAGAGAARALDGAGHQPERHGRACNLAASLAEWIAARCGTEDLPSKGRKLQPGDVLVLVRRRNEFARALVRALKSSGVPVAGLDRLVLTDQPAVADLLALCDTLLLPEDDLQLACVLTSPLGGLSDDSLMELAATRKGSLWEALRRRAPERGDWQAAHDFIAALLGRVDYASPHALLAEALGPLGGRARLFARLGPEAAEPVDELLNAALTYVRTHPPALQGFVHWLRQSGAEVKREAEGAGASVRIMTVHGAKGLQAPLVILPDTTALPPDDGPLMWAEDVETGLEIPVWSPRKELRCAALLRNCVEAALIRSAEEHNRLLWRGAHPRTGPARGLRLADRARLARRRAECTSWSAEGFSRLSAENRPFDAIAAPWEGRDAVPCDAADRRAG